MSDQKAITPEEMRHRFLSHLYAVADHWAQSAQRDHAGIPKKKTEDERIRYATEGVVFSMLCIFDGCTDLPAIDLVLRPHPEDKAFSIENGEDWVEDGMAINSDTSLHDIANPNSGEQK